MDLISRAKSITLTPVAEWPVIEREPTDTSALFIRYAVPLAAASAVAKFIGLGLIGAMIGYRLGFVTALSSALSGFIFSLIGIFLVGKLAAYLAPQFGGVADETAAMKLVVYSHTPAWLASLFIIIPPLGFLAILGLWGIYVLWMGVGPMLKVPEDKKLIFVLAMAACGIVASIIIGALAALVSL